MTIAAHGEFWSKPPSRRQAAVIQLSIGYINIGMSIITGIILVPLYLRYIPERLYGLWLASGGVVSWLMILDLGVASIMGQRIAAAYGSKDREAVGLYYFNGVLLQFFLMGLIFAGALVVSFYFPVWVKASPEESKVLIRCNFLACCCLGLTILTHGQKNVADALLRPLVPSIMQCVGSVVTIAFIVVLLSLQGGLYAIAIGMVAGTTVTLAGNLVHGLALARRAGVPMRYDRRVMHEMIMLSPGILVGKMGGALVGRIEPTLIALEFRPEVVVAYSVTRRAADIIQLGLDKILGSILAGFTHHLAEGNRYQTARLYFKLISFCLTIGAIALGTYIAMDAAFVSLWLGESFFAGRSVMLLLGFSTIAMVLNNMFGCLLGASGEIGRSSFIMGLEGFTRLLLMLAFIKVVGLPGLPLAVGVSCSVYSFVLFRAIRNRIRLSPAGRSMPALRYVIAGVTTLVVIYFGAEIHTETWTQFVFFTAGIALLLSVVWLPTDEISSEGLAVFRRKLIHYIER